MEESKLNIYQIMIDKTQNVDVMAKKIRFKRETLKKLKIMITNEFFDHEPKNDEFLSEMIDKIVNEYFKQYIHNLK